MPNDLERLLAARDKVATLVLLDPVFAPVFSRLEAEIVAETSTLAVIDRARAVLAVKGSAEAFPSLAPAPRRRAAGS